MGNLIVVMGFHRSSLDKLSLEYVVPCPTMSGSPGSHAPPEAGLIGPAPNMMTRARDRRTHVPAIVHDELIAALCSPNTYFWL